MHRSPASYALLVLVCLIAVFSNPAAPRAVSPNIVISQIYGGGGNSGATLRNDFIELFNRGSVPIDVTGWSVQYASATGTTWQRTNLSGLIPPGSYYLVQQAQGAGGTVSLPTPDAIGSTQMSATNGKVALVGHQTTLAGVCPSGVVDFVGFGSTANCSEIAPTPTLSNTTAASRAGNGCTDTDNNSADFTTGTPSPRNSASPTSTCEAATNPTGTGTALPALVRDGEQTTLEVVVRPGTGPVSTGITVHADLTAIGGPASQTFAMVAENVFSYVATIPSGVSVGTKAIVVTISDAQGRSSTTSVSLTVSPAATAIHDIQGSAPASPLLGNFVATSGVVTALKRDGFFLQAPDDTIDADPATSEGIFVFTGAAPSIGIGQSALVAGTVAEFFNLTEVSSSNAGVRHLDITWPMPLPIELTAAQFDPAGTQAALEAFEAMVVRAASLISVAPTNEFGEIETVFSGASRPMREPGIGVSLPVPPDPEGGTDCCIPRWDENPERLMIDTDGLANKAALPVTSNVSFSNVTGPMDFAFGRYKILPNVLAPTPNMTAIPVPAAAANEFTVAGYNIENFAGNATQRAKAVLAIRNVMRSPDVIGVIEVASLDHLNVLAAAINAHAVAAGEPDPQYAARLEPASPTATQNVGFLVKTSRVRIDAVTQVGKDETYINPLTGLPETLHDRPPLVLRATVDPLGPEPGEILVVVNHPRSFIDAELVGGDGPRVREKRTKQAESIARLLDELQDTNAGTPVIAIGDYNAFQFNDGYTDPIAIIKGTPTPDDQIVVDASPDLVDPNFVNLTDSLPPSQQYSFIFEGTPQALDHVLVSQVGLAVKQRYAIARANADFPDTLNLTNDATRPERSSDHDMPVAYFAFPGTPVVTLNGSATMPWEAYTDFIDPGATASDKNGSLPVTITGTIDVNVPGEYTLTYTATNGYRTTTVSRTVTVADTTAPAISNFMVTPSLIWPPNHQMVDILASYTANDRSGVADCELSASSTEPLDAIGDGDTEADWEILSPTSARVRAERSGLGIGRSYILLLSCTDDADNTSSATATVAVPRRMK